MSGGVWSTTRSSVSNVTDRRSAAGLGAASVATSRVNHVPSRRWSVSNCAYESLVSTAMSVHCASPSRRIENVYRRLSPSGSVTVQNATLVPGDE